jgi:hypothetical protein
LAILKTKWKDTNLLTLKWEWHSQPLMKEDNIERASKDSPSKVAHHAVHFLETEKHLKAKEAEFVNTIQDNLIREFEITGTAVAPKTPIESLYLL